MVTFGKEWQEVLDWVAGYDCDAYRDCVLATVGLSFLFTRAIIQLVIFAKRLGGNEKAFGHSLL